MSGFKLNTIVKKAQKENHQSSNIDSIFSHHIGNCPLGKHYAKKAFRCCVIPHSAVMRKLQKAFEISLTIYICYTFRGILAC